MGGCLCSLVTWGSGAHFSFPNERFEMRFRKVLEPMMVLAIMAIGIAQSANSDFQSVTDADTGEVRYGRWSQPPVSVSAEAEVLADRTLVVEGNSSSGSVITPIVPLQTTEIVAVVPYHYHRVPMGKVELFINAGDDDPMIPEIGTEGTVEIISGPQMLNDTSFSLVVKAPQSVGNWILTTRTVTIGQTDRWGTVRKVPRTLQFRLSTRPPIEDALKSPLPE